MFAFNQALYRILLSDWQFLNSLFNLFLREFRIQFVRKGKECRVRLLSTNVGNDDYREITFGIKPDMSQVHAIGTTMIEQGIRSPVNG